MKIESLFLAALICSIITGIIFEGDKLLKATSIIVIYIFFGWLTYKYHQRKK